MIVFLRSNKWLVLTGVVFILLIIPFLLFMVKGQSIQQGVTGFVFPITVPTPTPFISTPLSIISVSPTDQGENIDPKTPISVVFSRAVSPSEQETIAIHISPIASGSARWSQDKTTFTFIPTLPLLENTSYSATVIYSSISSPWSFSTASIPPLPPQVQQGRDQQTQLDQQWSDYQNSIQQNFPWYNSLPLSGDTYFVTFEPHSEKFTANLYPDVSIQTQDANRMKQEISSQLEALGVDLQKYPIIWNIVPITPTPAP